VKAPLSGVRVVEVASHVFVPMSGSVLTAWGVEVTKIGDRRPLPRSRDLACNAARRHFTARHHRHPSCDIGHSLPPSSVARSGTPLSSDPSAVDHDGLTRDEAPGIARKAEDHSNQVVCGGLVG
jgi:hypothetical protein